MFAYKLNSLSHALSNAASRCSTIRGIPICSTFKLNWNYRKTLIEVNKLLLTFSVSISIGEICWAIALGNASCICSAISIKTAWVSQTSVACLFAFTSTSSVRIALASYLTFTFMSGICLHTVTVDSTRILLARALWLLLAFYSWITKVAWQTRAQTMSVFYATLSVYSANSTLQTRILTWSGDTFLVIIAIIIGLTFEFHTFNGRFALVAFWAQTESSVVWNSAKCFFSTVIFSASICTFSVNARKFVCAVHVCSASF